ncbi:class I SAM-dependent rRNA methyltransferase [Vagococcus bubulae]|uniref:RlmI/RlmK family 23S rRNA methyltransferase n=1 Tax=Vagococcus bubulae TaxID=1977868 RepID=A0A429ZR30_9ENTE|nr:class I SAM-dependent rRNA methyltransferase [Vagococcus bubulae]RST96184.1 RlmI/RlmK family 23S rRNA methyltransferase [Vagococcus bubulae]
MKKVQIKQKKSQKYKGHYPLIKAEDMVNAQDDCKEWVSFYSEKDEFLGYGYLGKQHKGLGWMISFSENQPIDKSFLINLFNEAKDYRSTFFKDEATNAFRLFNGEGDGLGGVTIDWYAGFLVVSWYNDTIYQLKEEILEALMSSDIAYQGIYEKIRFNTTGIPESTFLNGTKAPEPLLIKENNITYATYLNEGLMTGIFLDQREVRSRLTDTYAIGKTVLNTFSYTGAFSVASAMGGAVSTTSVDLAKRSRQKTQEQFAVNGLNTDNQSIIVMDVFDYFKYAFKKQFTFDIVVMDPPSFARNKKKVFSVAKDYQQLTTEAVELLNKDGLLIASTNAANVSLDKFRQMVESGIKETGRAFTFLELYQLPEDFRVAKEFSEGNYLKVLFYQVK